MLMIRLETIFLISLQWNEAVRLFQAGMPTKKHWHLLKAYPDTFSGNEAADWLHDLLKINNNFGQQVF